MSPPSNAGAATADNAPPGTTLDCKHCVGGGGTHYGFIAFCTALTMSLSVITVGLTQQNPKKLKQINSPYGFSV